MHVVLIFFFLVLKEKGTVSFDDDDYTAIYHDERSTVLPQRTRVMSSLCRWCFGNHIPGDSW